MRFRSICCFFENENYIKAQVEMVKRGLQKIPQDLEMFFYFQAHGIPENMLNKVTHTSIKFKTSDWHSENIELDGEYQLAYQSRVGPQKWLDPDVEEVSENIPKYQEGSFGHTHKLC